MVEFDIRAAALLLDEVDVFLEFDDDVVLVNIDDVVVESDDDVFLVSSDTPLEVEEVEEEVFLVDVEDGRPVG